ncbi:MAG: glycerol-3-phosphate 1-O-acyltransferase PlsY [Vulcanimicrobiota bacterium]
MITHDAMNSILFLAASFLLGSIPFGVITGKLLKGIDIRDVGSGNIGTANAFRALGLWGGLLVFAGDVAKGFLPVHFACLATSGPLLEWLQVFSGIVAILGHNYSVFLRFKGGKGIATSLGVILALNWKIALLCLGIWGLIVLVTRYSSVGSLTGSFMLPILMALFKQPYPYIGFAVIACLFAFHAHRKNIRNLMEGKELKLTEKHQKKEQQLQENAVLQQ